MSDIKDFIVKNSPRFLDELFILLRIPSISSQKEHKDDMHRCARQYVVSLMEAGTDRAEIYSTQGHPVIYAEKIIDPQKPTVLVYGHYDVQPVDPVELWKSSPFEPVIRDGAIYARGANDDKGQSFMHVKAFEYLVSKNELPCNVKFLIEGEEEIGSPSLGEWARQNRDMLACDVILVSDTTMISEAVPSINTGMRGLAYLEVKVTGPDKDLHSGHYGGAIANPINVLCGMIAQLIDNKGRITIKGFYDDVVELSTEDRAMLARAPFDLEHYKRSIGINDIAGEEGYTTLERTGIRPCLDVNGIWGGYTGEGAKTVIPSFARAKISMRLVPNQDHKKIAHLFAKHFKSIAPAGVSVEVVEHHGGQGFLAPISSPMYQAAAKAVGQVYGIEPVPSRGGGSIPVLAELEGILGAPPLLMGFGLERDTIHSPNESYLLSQFHKGIESIILFYKYSGYLA
ncbi:MAG: dipeptidase [Bacteroidales bacterium]|jgi:acetylornithine deacetylase/succinyl-diaminopimelate desuccinylase-like protein|nr:dipeptidase [Bacteroidales bacterium]MDD2263790.1 dipeptidase [Bacteroidales bacterium]MDD2830992.1 dipeptidase [Bacteroidales bacterium]MDD3208200.1 dipeptidase [Bacteroidales bacterium]MDD3696758.1 dipeptidase [Bacteroidales bacterium]